MSSQIKEQNLKATAAGTVRLDATNIRLWVSIGTVLLGFLFGGTHVLFGAYPLGLALCSALRSGVWLALLGVVLGSLTLGRSGVIYALIAVLAVFLRVVISGSERRDKAGDGAERAAKGGLIAQLRAGSGGLFGESILLRVCTAVIAGFVAAIYELLLGGMSLDTVLFGICMIVLSALVAAALCCIYLGGTSVREVVFGHGRVCQKDIGKVEAVLYRTGALCCILLVSLSLKRYVLFGVDTAYIYATLITVFAAKRYGTLPGAVCGFFSSFAISGLYSPAFALFGAAAGALFAFGPLYALGAGAVVVGVWGAYAGGVSGFLSILPEYLIGACLMLPAARYLSRAEEPMAVENNERRATDMVGTMALAYRNREDAALLRLEAALGDAVGEIRKFSPDAVVSEAYAILRHLVADMRAVEDARRELNEPLTEESERIFSEAGFRGGVIRAFGRKRPYFIMAGEDRDGTLITAPALREQLGRCAGVRLGTPEYFRRDDMVLMECPSAERYRISSATARQCGDSGEPSGDTARVFSGKNGCAYAVISDGMGSGEEAKRTSELVAGFLSSILGTGVGFGTAMHALNSIIRGRAEECSATVDLFAFDLVSGDACFVKSGAAPSFIKRGDSLFRIKAETVPLGVIKKIDAERISAQVSEGDVVIMLSDGAIPAPDNYDWLTDLLNKPIDMPLADYARTIAEAAVENGAGEDDITVLVARVLAA